MACGRNAVPKKVFLLLLLYIHSIKIISNNSNRIFEIIFSSHLWSAVEILIHSRKYDEVFSPKLGLLFKHGEAILTDLAKISNNADIPRGARLF